MKITYLLLCLSVAFNFNLRGDFQKLPSDLSILTIHSGNLKNTLVFQNKNLNNHQNIRRFLCENFIKEGFESQKNQLEMFNTNSWKFFDKNSLIKSINNYTFVYFAKKIKIFIAAGEASGDYLGGMLMENLQKCADIDFHGIGGDYMNKAGLKTLFPITELSIMGIWEVVGKILHVKRLIDKTVDAIIEYQPDTVITIDSSSFMYRVDKKLKSRGFKNPIIHYVAPSVWAWRKGREKTMHEFIDKLLVLFPFEEEIFRKHHLDTVFVGHPISSDHDFDKPSDIDLKKFQKLYDLNPSKDLIVTVLPGSRKSELNKHIPELKECIKILKSKHNNLKILIPTLSNFKDYMRKITNDFAVKPIITTTKKEKVLGYYSSKIAVSACGTVVLELAKVDVPAVMIFKMSGITYKIVKWLMYIPYFDLVNIISGKEVVPELVQDDCTGENIANHMEEILSNQKMIDNQKKYYKDVIRQLTVDNLTGAREVLKMIK